MPQLTRARTAVAALAVGALGLSSLLAGAGAAQAAVPGRVAVAGTHPDWAVPAHRAGPVTRGVVHARVYLAARDAAGLAATATAVSTPGRPDYRHFLSPAQVQARFGPTPARIGAVRAWLRRAGLRVTGLSDHVAGGYLAVTGSVAAAGRAFGVRFARYRLAGQGLVRGPEQAVSVPAAVAASVLDVTGLSTARQVMHTMTAHRAVAPAAKAKLPPPGPNYWVAPPCGSYYNQKIVTSKPAAYGRHWPWAVCGHTPRQVRGVYGVTDSGMTGAGQTVAIVDAYASPTMLSDANTYARITGDRPFAPGQYQQYLPSRFTGAGANECGAQGWYGEQTLDVESVHGLAPGARVRYVAAASCNDPDLADALARIVNNRLASIISDSWGGTEASSAGFVDVYHLILQTAAAEGIGVLFSSGDNGYESPGEDPGGSTRIQVDYPTSDPWATSVGGTSLAIGARGNYLFETSWGTILNPLAKSGKSWQYPLPGPYPAGFDGGSGGGTSTLFGQPGYQQGVVPDRLSHKLPGGRWSASPMRVVPDVSAYADPATGFLIGQTVLQPNGKSYRFSLSRIGGTSVSCPTFAGIEADAQQAAGGPLGFANPAIYHRYGTDAFRDVTDHPPGPAPLAQVRANYTNPATKGGPILYFLRTLGIDGEGAAALPATPGYDDATGVGSPWHYIQTFGSR